MNINKNENIKSNKKNCGFILVRSDFCTTHNIDIIYIIIFAIQERLIIQKLMKKKIDLIFFIKWLFSRWSIKLN